MHQLCQDRCHSDDRGITYPHLPSLTVHRYLGKSTSQVGFKIPFDITQSRQQEPRSPWRTLGRPFRCIISASYTWGIIIKTISFTKLDVFMVYIIGGPLKSHPLSTEQSLNEKNIIPILAAIYFAGQLHAYFWSFGFGQVIIVHYVYSCTLFYIQPCLLRRQENNSYCFRVKAPQILQDIRRMS